MTAIEQLLEVDMKELTIMALRLDTINDMAKYFGLTLKQSQWDEDLAEYNRTYLAAQERKVELTKPKINVAG